MGQVRRPNRTAARAPRVDIPKTPPQVAGEQTETVNVPREIYDAASRALYAVGTLGEALQLSASETVDGLVMAADVAAAGRYFNKLAPRIREPAVRHLRMILDAIDTPTAPASLRPMRAAKKTSKKTTVKKATSKR